MPNVVYEAKTTADALRYWGEGARLIAFRIDSDGDATQEQLYAAAFALLTDYRIGRDDDGKSQPQFSAVASTHFAEICGKYNFTKRETDAAHSIAFVAALRGWREMVRQHRELPEITISKEAL